MGCSKAGSYSAARILGRPAISVRHVGRMRAHDACTHGCTHARMHAPARKKLLAVVRAHVTRSNRSSGARGTHST